MLQIRSNWPVKFMSYRFDASFVKEALHSHWWRYQLWDIVVEDVVQRCGFCSPSATTLSGDGTGGGAEAGHLRRHNRRLRFRFCDGGRRRRERLLPQIRQGKRRQRQIEKGRFTRRCSDDC